MAVLPHAFSDDQWRVWIEPAKYFNAQLLRINKAVLFGWIMLMVSQSGLMTLIQANQGKPPDQKAQVEMIHAWAHSNMGMNVGMAVLCGMVIIAGLSSSIAGLVRASARRWQAILGLILCGLCGACTAIFTFSLFTSAAATP